MRGCDVRDALAVEVKRDRLLVRRGHGEVEVYPREARHLVNTLVKGVVRSAVQRTGNGSRSRDSGTRRWAPPPRCRQRNVYAFRLERGGLRTRRKKVG